MGRYETLNEASKDLIDCMLPKIAVNFGVDDPRDVIPADICMRAWDCDRREHIYDQPEDDPRNWGLQFLKELISISRMKKGKLEEFQRDLREKVEAHEDGHQWARLADIKEVKLDYEHPERKNPPPVEESEEVESENSYYELVETDQPRRGRNHGDAPMFEARPVAKKRKRKNAPKRLRRGSSEGWERKDKSRRSIASPSSGDESFVESSPKQMSNPSHDPMGKDDLSSKYNSIRRQNPMPKDDSIDDEDLDEMSVSELEAHVQLTQAELRAARLRVKLIEARRKRKGGSPKSRQSSMDPSVSDVLTNGKQHRIRKTPQAAMTVEANFGRHRKLIQDDESDYEIPRTVATRKPVRPSVTPSAAFGEEDYRYETSMTEAACKPVRPRITSFATFGEEVDDYEAEEESGTPHHNARFANTHKRQHKPKVPVPAPRRTMAPAPRVRSPSPRHKALAPVANMVPPPQLLVKRKPTYLPKEYVTKPSVRQEDLEKERAFATPPESSLEGLSGGRGETAHKDSDAGEESPLFTPDE
ncbi:uncharacterized protein EI97DRAFT_14109 [Westerdykella ornata]|uniref:Uncharacterized protein n=1 Tax=Westerdykella ornata TaxID=318751 RepID=A0A6A6JYK4_WESOR|nr:uncharacterized protein EI97DRAFT_14109 [Westerdykella ornata]KAF2280928.1 hypothetical protein EI97DRAFT_14109 [Westerdykella ornata]